MDEATFTVPGYGTRRAVVSRLATGVSIPVFGSHVGGETRHSRAFYVRVVTSGSFEVEVVHRGWRERDAFVDWLVGYARLVSDDQAAKVHAMRVVVPAREFDKSGILHQGMPRGDTIREVVRRTELTFVGASNLVEYDSPYLSRFEAPDTRQSPHFFPTEVPWKIDTSNEAVYGLAPDEAQRLMDAHGIRNPSVLRDMMG